MGHRERLLVGARRCLYRYGYSRTTARDIVAASDTNLASISYHFGSKDELLAAAMIAAFEDWGREVEAILPVHDDTDLPQRLERFFTAVFDSFDRHRVLWVAGLEAFAQAEHVPKLREYLAEGYNRARPALGAMLLGPGHDEQTLRAAGSVLLSIMSGLATQCLLDRSAVSTPAQLTGSIETAVRQAALEMDPGRRGGRGAG